MIVDVILGCIVTIFIYIGFSQGRFSPFYLTALIFSFFISEKLLYKILPFLKEIFQGNLTLLKVFFFFFIFITIYELLKYLLDKLLYRKKPALKEKVAGAIIGLTFSAVFILLLYSEKEKHPWLKSAMESSKIFQIVKSLER